VATKQENLENLGNSAQRQGKICNRQSGVITCSFCGAKILLNTFVGVALLWTLLEMLTVLCPITIITITFRCDNLWKIKFVLVENPGNVFSFFLQPCGHSV